MQITEKADQVQRKYSAYQAVKFATAWRQLIADKGDSEDPPT